MSVCERWGLVLGAMLLAGAIAWLLPGCGGSPTAADAIYLAADTVEEQRCMTIEDPSDRIGCLECVHAVAEEAARLAGGQ